ncbi:hypothetical protein [Caulobacter sp. RHG1]|uniref:hypothetical protein n=1 Tax=Caulobacter sp. (strain RHG1) TaxID=2545762 RepID=UPI00155294B0|nr:hypothetical protein [Caulobacter sp. RHG1]NQE65092.1 hypothetical protein [Caulobacter sp. RHG1]
MRLLIDAGLLVWLCAALMALFYVFRPSPSLAVFATRGRALAMLAGILVGGGLAIALAGLLGADREPPVAPRPPVQAPPIRLPAGDKVRAHPERFLTLDGVTAYKGRDGAVLLTGVAMNGSGLAISNPRLSCRMTRGGAKAGTVSAVVQAVIPPGGRLIFAAINLGAADGAWDGQVCTVAAAKVLAP